MWQVLEALQQGASHDALVCCAGYVLGEYGRLVPEVPTHVQFALLQERFLTVSNETKVRTSRPVSVSGGIRFGCCEGGVYIIAVSGRSVSSPSAMEPRCRPPAQSRCHG